MNLLFNFKSYLITKMLEMSCWLPCKALLTTLGPFHFLCLCSSIIIFVFHSMWFITLSLQYLVNNESRMLSDHITDDTHSYKWTVSEAELWTPHRSELSGQTHHLEAPSSNLMGRFQRKVHSAWRKTHILALFTPGNPTGQLEVKLPRHGSDDTAPPGLWPRSPVRSKVKSPYE